MKKKEPSIRDAHMSFKTLSMIKSLLKQRPNEFSLTKKLPFPNMKHSIIIMFLLSVLLHT